MNVARSKAKPRREDGRNYRPHLWVVKALVLLLARTKNTDVKLQEAVLLALAALAKENAPSPSRSAEVWGLGPDVHGIAPLALVLNYTKSRNVEVQLAACLCATHIIRGISSTHLPPTSSIHSLSYAQSVYASLPLDDACIRAVVNMVNRVVGAEGPADVERRVKACFVLYHLTTDDKALCQFAFERGCLDTLAGAVKSITPPDPVPVPAQAAQEGLTWRWDESESEGVTRLREEERREADEQTIHLAFGTLLVNVIVVRGAKSTSTREDGAGPPDEEPEGEPEDRRVLNAALAAVCNIVMEFSPLRPIYLEQGLMPRLVHLLLHSGDSAIRMNALWAIKNLLFKSSTETKRDVMRELGWPRVFELLHDPDLGIQEQAYHVVRNLSETEDGIEMVFREMGADAILDSITESISLDSGMVMTTPVSPTSPSTSTGAGASSTPSSFPPHPLQDRTPTILQAISTLANLCNGPPDYTSLILSKPQLLMNLKTCLAECGAEVRKVGWRTSSRIGHYWAWDGCCDVPAWVPSSEFASSAYDDDECGKTEYGHYEYADDENGSFDESCEEFAIHDDYRSDDLEFDWPTASSLSDDGADCSDADGSERLVL
ncbi:hypothetical protein H1R20_g1464, partial [Candolleomyces eurysporus]